MPSQSGVRAGRAYVEYNLKDNMTRKMARIQKKLRSFGVGMVKIGGLVTAALTASVVAFTKIGDQLDKMSKRTGVAVEALSRLAFAAEQSGASLATVEKGIKAMQRTLLDANWGLSTATDSMDALGLSVEELRRMKPEDQFRAFAQAISEIESPSDRAALALKVFGRAGQELLPLMESGAAGIAKLEKEADALGRTMTTEQAATAAELADSWNRLQSQFSATAVVIGTQLAPAILDMMNNIKELIGMLNDPVFTSAFWDELAKSLPFTDWITGGAISGMGDTQSPDISDPGGWTKYYEDMGKQDAKQSTAIDVLSETLKPTASRDLYNSIESSVVDGIKNGLTSAREAIGGAMGGAMSLGANQLDALVQAMAHAPAAMSSAGTFNASALASISYGGVSSPDAKIAANTAMTVEALKDIIREMRNGGAMFT